MKWKRARSEEQKEYRITNFSEMQKKVLEYPEFRYMKIDFNSYLQKATECLLQGLMT